MKYIYSEKTDELDGTTVVRIQKIEEDGSGWVFTNAPGNRHYEEYLAWIAEGNTPEVIND